MLAEVFAVHNTFYTVLVMPHKSRAINNTVCKYFENYIILMVMRLIDEKNQERKVLYLIVMQIQAVLNIILLRK